MKDTTLNLDYFERIDSRNKAYFLGFIAADGAIVRNKGSNVRTLTITIHSKDRHLLEKFKEEINSSKPIYSITYKSKILSSYKLNVDHVRFTTSQRLFIENLENLGITSNKSLTMLDLLTSIPDEFKPAFIIGYFDGDGCFVDSFCVSPRKYKCKDGTITTHTYNHWVSLLSIKGTKEFLEPIPFWLNTTYALKQIKGQKIHTLRFTSNDAITKFYNLYNYCDFYLERKKSKFTRKILQVQTISPSYRQQEVGFS